MTEKQCSVCKEVLSIELFHKNPKHSSGYKSACSKCSYLRWKDWRDKNLESARKKDRTYHYIRKYGLSLPEAESLVENRVSSCLICGNVAPLVVDHCHTTDKVRGLICSSCNSLLGYSKDNVSTLENAIKYLKDFYE